MVNMAIIGTALLAASWLASKGARGRSSPEETARVGATA
jgi:hypothetical protein